MDTESRTSGPIAATIRVGPWDIDPKARLVSGPSGAQRLEPKPLALLLLLVSRRGEVVRRQDLLTAGWGEEMATDDVLSRAISELRRALGDDPRRPRYVETIRGSGYRLVVPSGDPVSQSATVAVEPERPGNRSYRWATAGAAVVVTLVGVVVAVVAMRRPTPTSDVDPHLVPITSLPGETTAPRLSPDGTRIAFTYSDSAQ